MVNEQVSHYLLNLHSGKIIETYTWAEFPIPRELIYQVHSLVKSSNILNKKMFMAINGNIFIDQKTISDDEIKTHCNKQQTNQYRIEIT